MSLGTKIVTIAVSSVFLTAAAGLFIQRSVIRRQGVEMIRDTMRTTILGAENARRSVSAMRGARMFDDARLKASAKGVSDYKETSLYKTVPVVAAWDSITEHFHIEVHSFPVRSNKFAKLNPRRSKPGRPKKVVRKQAQSATSEGSEVEAAVD